MDRIKPTADSGTRSAFHARLRGVSSDPLTITAAGLSAGIDMALHVVGRLAGRERARDVREGIEYASDPPPADSRPAA